MARVFFIVRRDHPERLVSLRKESAAQEARALAEIFSDRNRIPLRARGPAA